MEHIVIKKEEGLYDDFEISEDTLETSDNLFGITPYSENSNRDDLSNSGHAQRATWLAKDCQLLISLYKEEHPNLGKTFEVKTKRKLWQRITERLEEHGLCFTTVQVEGKWKSLKRSYANAIANRKLGKTRKVHPFEKDLSDVLIRRPSYPLRLQSGSTEESGGGKTQFWTDSEDETSTVSIGGKENPSPRRDSFSDSSEDSASEAVSFAKELRKLRREIAKGRREKRKYRNAKLNAYEKRTAALERQNFYKQELLSSSQNRK